MCPCPGGIRGAWVSHPCAPGTNSPTGASPGWVPHPPRDPVCSRDPAPPWGWSCQQCPSPRQDCPSAFPLPWAPLGWSGLSFCTGRWGLHLLNLNVLMSKTSRPQPSSGCREGTNSGIAVPGGRAKDMESLGIILERGNRGRGVPDSAAPWGDTPSQQSWFQAVLLKRDSLCGHLDDLGVQTNVGAMLDTHIALGCWKPRR